MVRRVMCFHTLSASAKLPGAVHHPQATGRTVRRLLFLLVPLVVAAESGAQVLPRGRLGMAPPSVWVSGGASVAQGWFVADGSTGSRWTFGDATQYQASVEKELSGVSVGLRGTTSMASLRYSGFTADGAAVTTDADANVSQLLAVVHVASGRGFHSVLELDGGATLYSNFRTHTSGEKLVPASDPDFTFSFGYGFGYGFSNRFAVEVVQDVTTILHQQAGLGGGDPTSARVHSTRLVGRLGLGERW